MNNALGLIRPVMTEEMDEQMSAAFQAVLALMNKIRACSKFTFTRQSRGNQFSTTCTLEYVSMETKDAIINSIRAERSKEIQLLCCTIIEKYENQIRAIDNTKTFNIYILLASHVVAAEVRDILQISIRTEHGIYYSSSLPESVNHGIDYHVTIH